MLPYKSRWSLNTVGLARAYSDRKTILDSSFADLCPDATAIQCKSAGGQTAAEMPIHRMSGVSFCHVRQLKGTMGRMAASASDLVTSFAKRRVFVTAGLDLLSWSYWKL